MTDKGKEVSRYADESMFPAMAIESRTPQATLLHCNNDPLGTIAACAGAYQGKFYTSLEDISDEDRLYYIQDMEKNILGMPSEAVLFHFAFSGISRSATHQIVRTRHASYAQESLRFAVKDDFPTRLAPMLQGTKSLKERALSFASLMNWQRYVPSEGYTEQVPGIWIMDSRWTDALEQCLKSATEPERARDEADAADRDAEFHYQRLIEMGMPAEDARGKLPHDILTRMNDVITLRALMDMAGQRLCTQAQFEHKQLWDKILKAIREYGRTVTYRTSDPIRYERAPGQVWDKRTPSDPWSYALSEEGDVNGNQAWERSSAWQFNLLADRFKPICYRTGKCEFMSDFDRYCPIRDRVQANHAIGRPSKEWSEEYDKGDSTEVVVGFNGTQIVRTEIGIPVFIPAIRTEEWLDPQAAVTKDGSWRTAEAQANIKDRRL